MVHYYLMSDIKCTCGPDPKGRMHDDFTCRDQHVFFRDIINYSARQPGQLENGLLASAFESITFNGLTKTCLLMTPEMD